jgi:hypothetical protein
VNLGVSAVEEALWGFGLVGPFLQGAVCVAMAKRKVIREFPYFFGYTIFHVFRYGALFAVRHSMPGATYFESYWLAQLVSALLGFAVIHEIYQHVFANYDALRELGSLLFRWAAVVLLIVSVLAAASAPGNDADRLRAAMFVLERSVRVMQCGLLVFLVLLASYFGLSWRRHAFGVALGFGMFASIELLAATLRSHLGAPAAQMWQVVNSIAYAIAVIIWASYFVARQPVPRRIELPARTEIDKWNQALLQLLHR